MTTIATLFSKPIDRRIEEVIKVDQADAETVRLELSEYIATDAIRDHYAALYKAFADAVTEPHEGVGVWVSGFFGSGKSSFAKILGYTVGKRDVGGRPAGDLFLEAVRDRKLQDLLEWLNRRVPTVPVIFDVSKDRGVRTANERLTELMYKAFLRELGYSEDFDLAELEMRLEHDGKLAEFERHFEKEFSQPWRVRRKLGAGIGEASRVMHLLSPKVYPHADSWAKEPKRADITAATFADRAFELMARRKPGHALLFVVDEVGQYIARSVDKMLDLQAVVEAFGVAGKRWVKERRAPAPCWVVVTSQEKLDEVVEALGSRKVELARVQARFPQEYWVDLKSTDIAEVASRRVLEKTPTARTELTELFETHKGRIEAFCTLERTGRPATVGVEDFAQIYPYLPYQIDLCIDIVSGLRLRRGANRHVGGSMRTMIKQAQQMLIHPRTRLADRPVGELVTLDRVYDLLYAGHLLPSEVTREVDDVPNRLPGEALALKVAKAITLLEAVKDPPRTVHNLAVVLHPHVAADPLTDQVQTALAALERVKVIRNTEEGYKLLTLNEKRWDERRAERSPRPADRARLVGECLGRVLGDPRVKNNRYKQLQTFKLKVTVDGTPVDPDGQIPLEVFTAQDGSDRVSRGGEARVASGKTPNVLYWVIELTDPIHKQVEELFRSREMIAEHALLANQNKLPPEDKSCLAEEQFRRDRLERDLQTRLADAIAAGCGFFRNESTDGGTLGRTAAEVIGKFVETKIPELYPKFELGVRAGLTGKEAEQFLTAVNLSGLSAVFQKDTGFGVVTNQGSKWVPNLAAEVCKEVLDFLKANHTRGERVTGKLLEEHFRGIGYGWDTDVLRLVLAVLLRGGAIEVTHKGRKHRNHIDPACREAFTSPAAFRNAAFAPREALSLKMLTGVGRLYEEITAQEVDIEEGAIAQAFQRLAAADRERLLPVLARVESLNLPGADRLREFKQTIEGVLEMAPDDCVKTLAGEGQSYKAARVQLEKLDKATEPANAAILQGARKVFRELWPVLKTVNPDRGLADAAAELDQRLGADTFAEDLGRIQQAADRLSVAYETAYRQAHEERATAYAAAVTEVVGLPEWAALVTRTKLPSVAATDTRDDFAPEQSGPAGSPIVSEEEQVSVLAPLLERAGQFATQDRPGTLPERANGHKLEMPRGELVCRHCRATIGELRTDLLALDARKAAVVERICELAPVEEVVEEPDEKFVRRVRVGDFLRAEYASADEVTADLDGLKRRLLELLAETGVTRVVVE